MFYVLYPFLTYLLTFSLITPCSPVKANRRFGGKYSLHIQSKRVSQTRYLFHASLLLGLLSFDVVFLRNVG
jgi:hypothetical protein